MPDPLTAAVAGLVALVVAYCVAGVAGLGSLHRAGRHRRDIDAWHVVMGATMIGMLVGHLSRPLATAALVLAGAAVGWGALSSERRHGNVAHARLLVGGTAMSVMTLPLAAPAGAAGASAAPAGTSAMSPPGTPSMLLLVVLLVAVLSVVAAARLPAVVRRGAGASYRLDACCDVVMAGAMAVMLAALL